MSLHNAASRQPSVSSATSQQSSILAARVESKKKEHQKLMQLRDLSSALAEQMRALELKIENLQGGAEGEFFHPSYRSRHQLMPDM